MPDQTGFGNALLNYCTNQVLIAYSMLYQNLKNVGQFKSQYFNTTNSRVQSGQYLNRQKSITYSFSYFFYIHIKFYF